jgi:hypothetical protein
MLYNAEGLDGLNDRDRQGVSSLFDVARRATPRLLAKKGETEPSDERSGLAGGL